MAAIGKIILTPEEEQELLCWARSSKMEHRYVLRSEIILMSSQGVKYKRILKKAEYYTPRNQ